MKTTSGAATSLDLPMLGGWYKSSLLPRRPNAMPFEVSRQIKLRTLAPFFIVHSKYFRSHMKWRKRERDKCNSDYSSCTSLVKTQSYWQNNHVFFSILSSTHLFIMLTIFIILIPWLPLKVKSPVLQIFESFQHSSGQTVYSPDGEVKHEKRD